jgi:hypothetical protein
MLDPKDLYTCTAIKALTPASGGANFGTSIAQYEIRRYLDVRNLTSLDAYMVTLRHRLVLPNSTAFQPGPQSTTAYSGYPALITNNVQLSVAGGGTILLNDFFPKTLNSAVSTSATTNAGGTTSTSNQASSGSSTSNTNTFGVQLSGGFFGEIPMANLSLDYSHTWEKGSFDSNTQGSTAGRETSASQAASMSIKDWSAYGYADVDNQLPSWIWGQSYPWDAIQDSFGSNNNITLPDYVQARLLASAGTTEFVLPPSQLSQFGVDFTMMARWLIAFPEGATASEAITFTHTTNCYRGGHSLGGTTPPSVTATLDTPSMALTATYGSSALDMSSYALEPVLNAGAANGAAIGFASNPFTLAPTSAASPFKIISPSNNLQVTGTGFGPGMAADFSASPSLTVTFKVVDRTSQFALLMMHWLGASSEPCKLTVTVNDAPPVTVFVDATEGQGGQGDVTAIDLRNTDFTSISYHDYLVLGLNTVTIDIAPTGPVSSSAYTLFALALGQA